MRRSSQLIDELLKDLSIQGGPFTWKGGSNNQRIISLDRFLVSDDWEEYFGSVAQATMPRPVSDHLPILLEGWGSLFRGPIPFRFENMWFNEAGFKN